MPAPAGDSWTTALEPGQSASGITLADALLNWPPPSISTQIDIALELTRILTAIHRAGVTHGSLHPANVLLVGNPLRVMIVGFEQATTIAEREPEFSHHTSIPGTLAALAPEQTGRTGRPIDQRADLYGLGIVLYHLAAGAPPFDQRDPLHLVHDVLARVPVAPADRADVPPIWSMIIMRLLEKEPDQRYQSADGLACDLRELRGRLLRGQALSFSLAEHDFPHRLSAPSRLVGRDSELTALESAVEAATRGTGKAVLVSGAPGVGKTALINELRPMVTALGGWFVSGKSDQYRRDLPSDAVSQALKALGRLLLTEAEADLVGHRARLLRAIGPNLQLIASIQPELGLALGMPEGSPPAEDANASDRVARAALDAMRAMSSPKRPLVVVLDDLQWASAASFGLLDALFQEEPHPGLLVVGAYRPGEVDATHPLSTTLPRWMRSSVPPMALRPQNLPTSDLSTMIAEMLRLGPGQATALASAVGKRTDGNPFDTVTLLNALREEGVLARDDQGWWWDEALIRHHIGQGDVVELLAARISRLPAPTAELLSQMACLGGETDAELLCLASGLSPEELESHLVPALEDGLLVMGQAGQEQTTMMVRFRHDRVQQAATSRLDKAHLRAVHLASARRLVDYPKYAGLAAEQYLQVVEDIVNADERYRVFQVFRDTADVLHLVNPTMAERFLASALTMLDSAERSQFWWENDDRPRTEEDSRHQRIAVEVRHHAALYNLGRLTEADARYQSIERLNPSPLELAEAACERISCLTFRDRPFEAVDLGLDLLRRLGVDVPRDDQISARTEEGLARLQAWAAMEDGIASDLTKPEASDAYAAAAARLISRMIPPAFFVSMPIMPWLVFECQRLWDEYGPCSALIGPLAHASFVTIMLAEDHRTGYHAIRRVIAVTEKHGYEPECSHAKLILALSSAQWFEPLDGVIELAQRALEGLVRGGDKQNSTFADYVLIPSPLECTPTLEEYLPQVEARIAFTTSSGNDQTRVALGGYRQLAKALLGQTKSIGSLADDTFDPESHLAAIAENPVATAYARITLGIASLIFEDYEALAEHSAAAMAVFPVYAATLSTSVAYLLRALALAESVRQTGKHTLRPGDRAKANEELDKCRAWMAARSYDCEGNFEHLLCLIDAERSWARGDALGAARTFDTAMLTVQGRLRPWHAALITERAAKFHLAHGLKLSGDDLLARARDLYQKWGAVAKVQAMEEAHPHLRTTKRLAASDDPLPMMPQAIDLLAVLRACQALSSETALGRLYTLVREVLRDVTGATGVRVVLRREDPRGWFIPRDDGDTAAGPGTPLDSPEGPRLVPLLAFRYAERTQEPVVVPDVIADTRFTIDPYLRRQRCRSLMVMPIFSKGVLRAMLILEHNLSGGAFTEDGLDALRLIAGQLAVSLENAMLYEELEERVRERTQTLRAAQNEMVSMARHVGMADLASALLQDIGDALSDLNVSMAITARRLRSSKVDALSKTMRLLRDNRAQLATYLTKDTQGKLVPECLSRISSALDAERRDLSEEVERLASGVERLTGIVTSQRQQTSGSSAPEATDVEALVEDALTTAAEAIERNHITIIRQTDNLPVLVLDRARVLRILVTLIGNATAAVAALQGGSRLILVSAELLAEDLLRLHVRDSGEGTRPEHLPQLFSPSFGIHAGGHGFGLHSCAMTAREMAGTLTARSEGLGYGTSFILDLPVGQP